ncbi:p-aminobenzoyl-glutamate transport protein [Saliniradius amylolyticus]|uniref:p-aminobenzoyl-glutamate transport protein n=1 Tax=Saliniradius amylolyticus TaxID=2183582 RepID=A0A2S2E5Z7_9ALTE|nr:AbgT family transporter [Saliniradius amylolyticus]AWL12387.1 p-aminobenzoyl-glutamate transport protein [Saliniradius amylolyticus]
MSTDSLATRFLDKVERVGNKLPDPAVIFLISLIIVWVMSALLSHVSFSAIDPRTNAPVEVNNLLTGASLADFLSRMVTIFTSFPPLGVVLVAMLGVGVAEHSGFISAGLKRMLDSTPKALLTPSIILVAIVSHTATDAGYVLVIPIAGVIFYAMGRHPLAGIAAAFAGVSGGFGANFVPSGIDPLLQSFTQSAAQIVDPSIQINPLNNWFFTSASSIVIILLGWYLTDKVVEPRLQKAEVDGDPDEIPRFDELNNQQRRALRWATLSMVIGIIALVAILLPADSPMRDADGSLSSFGAPIMQSIVPLIFLLFVIPGLVYGFLSGTFESSRDAIAAMSKSMESMAYYIVMVFFCALFIDAFGKSNLGALMAIEGGQFLKSLELPSMVTIVGMVFLTAFVNLFVGSASAKWALLGPIFVPMLMQLNISPDLTQAAYRLGDSSSNIITPLMPYFPLVVVFCQRYVKNTGIGTVLSMMLPYSIAILTIWTAFLLLYWGLDIPLGLQSSYTYPAQG